MDLETLIAHSVWANGQCLAALEAQTHVPAQAWKLLSHITLSERAWFQRIQKLNVNAQIWTPLPAPELRALQAAHADIYQTMLRGDLSEQIAYRRFSGEEGVSTVNEILLHLLTHGFHHRGQIATLASSVGAGLPNLDFIHYCRTVKART